jgi:hypothetical protein
MGADFWRAYSTAVALWFVFMVGVTLLKSHGG